MACPTQPDPPPDPDSLAGRLKRRFGEGFEQPSPLEPEPVPEEGAPQSLFETLRSEATRGSRYRLLGEIARGGMGVVLRIWDNELRRTLAMKVVLGRGDPGSDSTPDVDPKSLGRFLEEAQITGQLDHPGIVPVHELGLGADGRVYFTMRLVKGEDLRSVFEKVRAGEDGWTQVRALGVLLKVCEAMSYAHSKRVVHRDLKPANVMVGKFGEVYAMDWGLARVTDRQDRHDLRLQPQAMTRSVLTERREEREKAPDSPLVTMDGDVVGTPSFMPPEQAMGQLEKIGPHSDVYAIGAMLYQLLTGTLPYIPSGARVSHRTVLQAVLHRAPEPVESLAPKTPPELVAICEKAMAREIPDRYRNTEDLASDLRAFLEGRVVRAYETGTWAETRKWVERNKPLAGALAAALILLAAGVATTSVFASRAVERARDLESANAMIRSKSDEVEVKHSALQQVNVELARAKSEAETNAAGAMRLKDLVLAVDAQERLTGLIRRADELWPAHPAMIESCEAWIAEAEELVAGRAGESELGTAARPGLAEYGSQLSAIRARALPATEGKRTWEFAQAEDSSWHAQLTQLAAGLQALENPDTGLLGAELSETFGWGVRRRCEFAKMLRDLALGDGEWIRRWEEARSAIQTSPKYAGLALPPQTGLLPLGADPESGLWDFAHLQTGEPAERGSDGRLVIGEDTGLVFVLIPAGTFTMGAQKSEPDGEGYDPLAESDELPPHRVTLAAFLLSKYEMTQGQWLRITGRNPSAYDPSREIDGRRCDLRHPVEQVTWESCRSWMQRMGLTLPTEAQWERACRADTDGPWWTGTDPDGLGGFANVADRTAQVADARWAIADWFAFEDGWVVHAPAGSFRANPFGLHDMLGNVWEWCRDGSGPYQPADQIEPELPWSSSPARIMRGGCFDLGRSGSRCANRGNDSPEARDGDLGLRPARALEH